MSLIIDLIDIGSDKSPYIILNLFLYSLFSIKSLILSVLNDEDFLLTPTT